MEKDKKSVNESEIALVVLWVKLQDVHTKEMCNWNMVLATFSAVSDKLLETCVVPECSIMSSPLDGALSSTFSKAISSDLLRTLSSTFVYYFV